MFACQEDLKVCCESWNPDCPWAVRGARREVPDEQRSKRSTSSKIPATDRSGGGPGSSHADKPHDGDVAGAHHQKTKVEKKHPSESDNSAGGGTKHEKRHPGESDRS